MQRRRIGVQRIRASAAELVERGLGGELEDPRDTGCRPDSPRYGIIEAARGIRDVRRPGRSPDSRCCRRDATCRRTCPTTRARSSALRLPDRAHARRELHPLPRRHRASRDIPRRQGTYRPAGAFGKTRLLRSRVEPLHVEEVDAVVAIAHRQERLPPQSVVQRERRGRAPVSCA